MLFWTGFLRLGVFEWIDTFERSLLVLFLLLTLVATVEEEEVSFCMTLATF